MGTEAEPKDASLSEKGRHRRNFLKAVMAVGAIVTVGSIASAFRILAFVPPPSQGTSTGALAWPRVKVTNISSLGSAPLRFYYPLVDTPNVMVKLGQTADYGVGPDSDIVAFSDVCQHLGCYYAVVPQGSSPPCSPSYKAPAPEGYCCCHGGEYDLAHGAKVIGGPPPRPVPQVVLQFDQATGDIYAVAMGGPTIFGRGPPGTTDPGLVLKYDLEGGTLVTDATVITGEAE